jgi:sugar transferase (PEP-CTERM/EpsH1 system associated)
VNILFLTHRLPYAPNRGDRIRAYYLLRQLSQFARVSLFSLVHDDDERSHANEVPFAAKVTTAAVPRFANLTRGALRLPTARPLTHTLLDAPEARTALARLVADDQPDLVLAYCSGMARFALEPPLDSFPFVLDMVDVDSGKWADLGDRTGHPRRWVYRREARTLAAFEVIAANAAAAVTVVTERERQTLRALAPHSHIVVLPNGVDVAAFAPPSPPAEDSVVVFTGMMDYEPNVNAVVWFAKQVWPRIRQDRPDARFVIVGAGPTRAVLALAEGDRSITVTGRVESVQPHLWSSAVSVAPVSVARGLQNKVLEALAAGLPAVVSTAVAAGLPPEVVSRGCLVADEPDDFARAVIGLLDQPALVRRAMAAAAGVHSLSWDRQLAPIEGILDRARHGAASVREPHS